MLPVHSQRGVACETNALHVWIQFHGALRGRNAHITVYDVTTWSWVNLVHPLYVGMAPTRNIRESVDSLCRDGADAQYMQYLSKSRITLPQTR